MSLLAVEQLAKSFGGVVAARNVSFALEAGKLLAIIGPNGAGKSTIFNMVGGQLVPDSGRVLILFSRKRPTELGDAWMGQGFAFDLLSATACRP